MTALHSVLRGGRIPGPALERVVCARSTRPLLSQRLVAAAAEKRAAHSYILAIDLFHPKLSMEMSKWAVENLGHSDDRVILCNIVVVPPVSVFTQTDGTLVTSADVLDAMARSDQIESDMEARLREFESDLCKEVCGDCHFETRVVADQDVLTAMVTSDKKTVIEKLDAQVNEIGAASCTLVLAATSHGGLAELLTGSVAAGSVRKSAADAVVVYRTAKPRNAVGGKNRTIVLPVDGTELSELAVHWTANHVARKGDVVKLIHVIPSVPFLLPTPTLGLSPATMLLGAEVEARNLEESMGYIQNALVPILQQHDLEYEIDSTIQITDGSTETLAKKILEHATDAHLIVIGSASHGGINEFVFGSIANYIDHHATVPVIVVHGTHTND